MPPKIRILHRKQNYSDKQTGFTATFQEYSSVSAIIESLCIFVCYNENNKRNRLLLLLGETYREKKGFMLDQGMDCPASNTWLFNDSHPGVGKRRFCAVQGNNSHGYGFLLHRRFVKRTQTIISIILRFLSVNSPELFFGLGLGSGLRLLMVEK